MTPRKAVEVVEITPAGTAALLEPDMNERISTADLEPVLLHVLDYAPVGSKLVGTDQGVVFASPEGGDGRGAEILLPKTDLAGRLPAGARIQKLADGAYRSVQLDAGREDKPALITATAYEAIVQFVPYFHG